MNALWEYFWPVFGIGLLCGVLAGMAAFRAPSVRVKATRAEIDAALAAWASRRVRAIAGGIIAALIAAALWHGPSGAADRFSNAVEQEARQVLTDNNAPAGMTARIHRAPLTREVVLSGPGDDFQRAYSAQLVADVPGASDATWHRSAGVPLILQGAAAAFAGFLCGLVLAYLVELRRRHNSQWTW